MQVPAWPTLEVVSFVTSEEENQHQNDDSHVIPSCIPTYCPNTDLECTQTVCSSSDQNGGNSCTDECHPGSSGC